MENYSKKFVGVSIGRKGLDSNHRFAGTGDWGEEWEEEVLAELAEARRTQREERRV